MGDAANKAINSAKEEAILEVTNIAEQGLDVFIEVVGQGKSKVQL